MAPPFGNDAKEASAEEKKRGPSRRSLLAGVAAFGALGAAGCSRVATASGKDGGDLLDRLKAQGVVRLGIAGEIPFGYIDKNGKLTGEAPELARVIFKRLGVDSVQPVPTEFGSLIPGLSSQQFDVVAAGMYINAERCEQVIFSDPDYQMLDSFIVRKGNPKNLHDYKDVVESKAKFATGTGYAEIQYAVDAGYKESDILIVPDQVAGLNAVEAGRVDVFAGTALTTREVVKKSRKTESTKPFAPLVDGKPHVDGGGFAFRPTETGLRDAFNVELRKLKESGELFRILQPFGFTKNEMTDMTAKELCGG
ncbi:MULTISPECIES: ectoine/hydroxyectoine ABC transporter substrate-binding protein EhuB [Streptomyces]|jgi:polar amino acid transport system substrate-binding protein|uniref:ectoine/hydroxyectoine ABC transporter substrate-binding protein EhuB n=1 Tax=Streptomyces TaxID=1883 RepID=UPI00099E3962|nr:MULTISPECIES: ectoine/hydroxyectoine ABC transporter substrate-binding protein EhuB [Streptomyces phaeochromogenes group]MCR3731240.1 polar amino acid transport system substrate-binding protein [Streptomyces umbrinus]MCX4558267.1 ectoine/hydroxyectoine ABC transporter substrate-binding protein EhuB [Streptomyces phaeochromogenes]MCX5596556.1 ectoine/hydroxyectoine ABC transporter substrate-binding protein EhuB [Streptomyces phaeochromogenes]GHB70872.1 ectoine/hydroxyectoine ABC transporter s